MVRLLPPARCVVGFGLLLVVGCGGSDRNAVSGTINFKGKPLDQGMIVFTPESESTKGFGQAPIADGKYSIPAAQGLTPGTYVVRVSSGDTSQKAKEEPVPGIPTQEAKERIPSNYNEFSKTTFEVKPGQNNVFNLDIP